MNSIICKKILEENGLIVKTTPNGKITYANQKFCDMSGFTLNELVGNTQTEIYEQFKDTVLLGETWKGVITHTTKFGKPFFMDISVYPIKNSNGRIVELISYGNDLTHYLDLITYDQLTHLKNRDSLKNDIKTMTNYICIIVNLDGF